MKFGLFTVLFLIFLILKLTNYIDWSWWWVVSPLLFVSALWGVGLLVGLGLLIFAAKRRDP